MRVNSIDKENAHQVSFQVSCCDLLYLKTYLQTKSCMYSSSLRVLPFRGGRSERRDCAKMAAPPLATEVKVSKVLFVTIALVGVACRQRPRNPNRQDRLKKKIWVRRSMEWSFKASSMGSPWTNVAFPRCCRRICDHLWYARVWPSSLLPRHEFSWNIPFRFRNSTIAGEKWKVTGPGDYIPRNTPPKRRSFGPSKNLVLTLK